jgi:hypothetical protein
VSAKRYALFRRRGDEIEIVKSSKHGLGHLLDPRDPDRDPQKWIDEVWALVVGRALTLAVSEPEWLDRPAVGRFTVSTPELLRPFAGMNKGKPYAEQVKPHNFLLVAYRSPFGAPTDAEVDPEQFQLVAPWTPDARQWGKSKWINRYSGKKYGITTRGRSRRGLARVMTYREYIALYESHPESKSLAPDRRPCDRATTGELGRREVQGLSLTYVGKESNRLHEREVGLVSGEGEFLTTYEPAGKISPLVLRAGSAELSKQLGLNRSTIKRWKSGQSRPRPGHERKLLRYFATRRVS